MVKKRCAALWEPKPLDKLTAKEFPARPLISDRYKVFGCKAAKVASTNLQRIFYVLNGLTNETDTGKVNKGAARKHTNTFFKKSNNQTEIDPMLNRLKTYTTFMFVRHPLERIVSAFRDEKPNPYFRSFRKKGKTPTFPEYIEYVLRSTVISKSRPVLPLYKLCNPCPIQYDFIGSLDDFNDDMKTILQAIEADKAVTIPQRNETGYSQSRSSTVVKEFFKDISEDKIENLEKQYEIDYILFGFKRYRDMKWL